MANAAFGLAQLDFREDGMCSLIARASKEMAKMSAKRAALQDLPMTLVF